MNNIEILVFIASLCLPIWMGEIIDYAMNIDDLFELLSHEEEEIFQCLQGLIFLPIH